MNTRHWGRRSAPLAAANSAWTSGGNRIVSLLYSLPIDSTPWSGDHGIIKGDMGTGGTDKTRIDGNGNVWTQEKDGSWSNEGPVTDYTGSGKAAGQTGSDREEKNGK